MIVSELVAILGFDVRGEGELRKFNQGLDRAEHSARGFSTTMVALGGAIAGALAGLQLGRLTGDFVSSITRVGAEFENYTNTLETLEGSQEAARRSFDWIGRFADENSKAIDEATEAYIKMKAYGLDPATGSLKSIGDTASAMGKTMMEGVEALADAATGEFERLKEFGVRASVEGDRVTFLWSENGKQITKTVNKNATEIIGFMTEYGKRFDGQMEKQGKSWDGLTLRMANHWTRFLKAISDAGYYDDAKRRLDEVADKVQEWWDGGLVGGVAQSISDGLVGTMNTVSHLAAQAYRIGSGFYYAADGVVTLIARLNGLGKTTTAIGLGAALLTTSTMGRRAMMAVARRVPMVATLLVLDDILAGLNGDKSVVGSLEGGQAALDGIKASFEEVVVAANELAGTMNGIFGWNNLAGEDQLDTLMRSLKEYLAADAVEAFRGIGQMIRDVATALKAIDGVLKDPEAAWERFVTAAIAQLDRLVAAIDNELGGALTRFGFIGATAKENPGAGKVATTGKTTRAPSSSGGSTGMADLVRSGMQTVEGMKAEYGLTEEAIMKVALDLSQFLTPANQALRIKADLSRGFTAVANLDITQWMANADRAETRLRNLQAVAGGASGAVRSRPQVAQSAAAP